MFTHERSVKIITPKRWPRTAGYGNMQYIIKIFTSKRWPRTAGYGNMQYIIYTKFNCQNKHSNKRSSNNTIIKLVKEPIYSNIIYTKSTVKINTLINVPVTTS
jgi:hypothetical protein